MSQPKPDPKKKPKGNVPTHVLKIKDPVTNIVSVVGAGWVDAQGFISIKMNAHVVLSEVELRGCYVNLFPNTYETPARHVPAPETPVEQPPSPLTGWESEVPS
jgi:hypothetical protein